MEFPPGMRVHFQGKMKSGKTAGPSGIVVEMLKSTGSKGIEHLRKMIVTVVKNVRIPEDWKLSFILNINKGKGDVLNRGNYRGINSLNTHNKIMKNVVHKMIREMIELI